MPKQKGVIENIEESQLSRGINLREKKLEEKLKSSSVKPIGKDFGGKHGHLTWELRLSR